MKILLSTRMKSLKVFIGQRAWLEETRRVDLRSLFARYRSFTSPSVDLFDDFLSFGFGENTRLGVFQLLLTSIQGRLFPLTILTKGSLNPARGSFSDQSISLTLTHPTALETPAKERLDCRGALKTLDFEKSLHFGWKSIDSVQRRREREKTTHRQEEVRLFECVAV